MSKSKPKIWYTCHKCGRKFAKRSPIKERVLKHQGGPICRPCWELYFDVSPVTHHEEDRFDRFAGGAGMLIERTRRRYAPPVEAPRGLTAKQYLEIMTNGSCGD